MKEQDIALRILFLRHGEKEIRDDSGDTELTERGRLESRKKGTQLKDADELRVYTGNKSRRIETGKLILENSPILRKTNCGLRDELSFPHSVQFFKGVRSKSSRMEQIEFYLELGNHNLDSKTKSPVRLAREITALIEEFKKQLDVNSKILILSITSDFNIEAYLFYTIGIKTTVGYLEGFEILVGRDRRIVLVFRDQEYQIS